MDSVLEDLSGAAGIPRAAVSILVSVDSVLEAVGFISSANSSVGFNPSFCGFGIGGLDFDVLRFKKFGFNPSFCGFGIGGHSRVPLSWPRRRFNPSFCGFGIGGQGLIFHSTQNEKFQS